MSTATTTKTPFTVFDFAGRTLAVKSRKDAAVKYAIAQDAEFVTNPAGKAVWTNPEAKVSPALSVDADNDDDYAAEMAAADQANTEAEMSAEAKAIEPIVLAKTGPVTVTVVDAEPKKRVHKQSPKALRKPWVGEKGGRFYFAEYAEDAPTAHARAPYSILRARLGCTWAELEALGLMTQPAARAWLAKMDAPKQTREFKADQKRLEADLAAIREEKAAAKAEKKAMAARAKAAAKKASA